jgi:hypothetical protein
MDLSKQFLLAGGIIPTFPISMLDSLPKCNIEFCIGISSETFNDFGGVAISKQSPEKALNQHFLSFFSWQ